MAEGNWIKLYRKMIDDPIFVNSTGPQVKVLMTVMFLAAWTPKKWDVLGHEFTIQPGEVFISSLELARRAGDDVSRNVVRKALVRFEKLGFWTTKRTKRGVLIHIENWGKYQLYEDDQNHMENQCGTTGEPMRNHRRTNAEPTNKKESKNSKNVRREEYNTPLPPKGGKGGAISLFERFSSGNHDLLSALKEWQEMRIRMKKPLTEKAAELNLKDLQQLSGGDEPMMVAIVSQSIKRGWQGFYALKEAQAAPRRNDSMEDLINELSKLDRSIPEGNSHWDA